MSVISGTPSSVLSLGYGAWGGINLLPTMGFGNFQVIATSDAFYRPYSNETADALTYATESIDVLYFSTETTDHFRSSVDDQVQ